MKRMTKIALIAVVVGLAIPLIWGFTRWKVEREQLLSLEQALWVVDHRGFAHSPTSEFGRSVISSLGGLGVDTKGKYYRMEIFINFSGDLDALHKVLLDQERK